LHITIIQIQCYIWKEDEQKYITYQWFTPTILGADNVNTMCFIKYKVKII